jgi:hypothetical protein
LRLAGYDSAGSHHLSEHAPSPALEHDIRSRVTWLETFYPDLLGARVTLEVPSRAGSAVT